MREGALFSNRDSRYRHRKEENPPAGGKEKSAQRKQFFDNRSRGIATDDSIAQHPAQKALADLRTKSREAARRTCSVTE